jgi:hypothetical protein
MLLGRQKLNGSLPLTLVLSSSLQCRSSYDASQGLTNILNNPLSLPKQFLGLFSVSAIPTTIRSRIVNIFCQLGKWRVLLYKCCEWNNDNLIRKADTLVYKLVNWAPRHEGVLEEWTCSSTHSLTSALDGCAWSASRPGRFTRRVRASDTHWIGGWVVARAVLDVVVKRKIPSLRRESNPRTQIVQPVA